MSNFVQNPVQLLLQIKQKTSELTQLNQVLNMHINSELAQHCRIANWRDSILIIEIDSASWATQLRFIAPELLNKLSTHKELHNIQQIKWYIRPTAGEINDSVSKQLILSEESAELIADTAAHITNPELQAALQKLAKHTSNKK